MNVEVTPLPGIGTRQDFVSRSGRRIGVITHRDGHFDLIVSKHDDPDSCVASIPLTVDESGALANLLGAPQLVAYLEDQNREVAGIKTRQLPLVPGSPFDGRTLGDTALRTRTAVSVVAVVRAGTVHPSPRPDFVFGGGDLLITVGTSDGLAKAADVLEHG
ncbi:cation:proton antiporter regulatory subunit [Actinokineospora bangkokensis]|uniref:Potassium transporter TrkA n=1 Tax=Actinokineospora bangkokensis TaxID=1193682 RepID=A0A1Q9LIE6_9PSEU|nr:TrkA C-terminal domain-containing protein [Actinokineospora bangkokensis]OLR91759.1 potassium transporter TrkA [Actinokineospora bangkokensis]